MIKANEYFEIKTIEELEQAYNSYPDEWSLPLDVEKNSFFKGINNRIITKVEEKYLLTSKIMIPTRTKVPNPFKPSPEEELNKYNKYMVKCKGAYIDVYNVLTAFDVVDPGCQQAIKKLLKAGQRGHKNKKQDLEEAIIAINRSIELIDEKQKLF